MSEERLGPIGRGGGGEMAGEMVMAGTVSMWERGWLQRE